MDKTLSQKEFDLLMLLYEENKALSQRMISDKLNVSVGTVNKIIKDFSDLQYIEDGKISLKGIEALEPYKVKRAVFIAAGFSARLAPITLNTPKPLVRVNGNRIIDTALDAIVKAEIPEIIIVRGYLGEQFDQLLYKYPNIKFVENPAFNEHNNIASAMCVRYNLQNAYVLDADLILKNPKLIRKYEYQTNVLGIPVDRTDDWCLTVDKNGYVNNVTMGGINGYREVGISYFDSVDGAKLAEDLSDVYNSPGGKERYWEQTALVYKKDNYKIVVRECNMEDVIEIDTFSELKKIDKIYDI